MSFLTQSPRDLWCVSQICKPPHYRATIECAIFCKMLCKRKVKQAEWVNKIIWLGKVLGKFLRIKKGSENVKSFLTELTVSVYEIKGKCLVPVSYTSITDK